jgi:ATP-binding cassette subfamily F protein uup
MHYLSAEGLTKSFGIKPLFHNITFHISQGDKIALIAKNGSGKSTLLRIICGLDQPDSGTLRIDRSVTVALFEQEPQFEEEKSVADNIFHYPHPAALALRDYELAVDSNADGETMAAALAKMDELSAWDFDAKVKQILGKLNIHHLDQPVKTLSGGQRKRVALAQTLIDIGFEPKHTLLIMDEPTNHLDVAMVEWLEHYLASESVTLLMVTHDRYFLDSVCDEIWELDGGKLQTYKGDYETYLEQKAARMESTAASIDKARNEYRRELEWMRKQPKARTTKSRSREQNFYDVESRAKQRITDEKVALEVKMTRLGGKVAELKKVYKAYGEKTILKGFDYTFKRGERIGIIGVNGAGKSTFLKMLTGEEPADSGKINIGDTVVFGNFSQTGLQYKEDVRMIEFVKDIAENFPLANGKSLSASQFLERFLFTPDQQYTYLSKLSGGEKKRLQLLSILFRNPNFLILDEPTNDLDLPTLSVLEEFLSDYNGCILLVSHDRYFMDRLVDHLFVFEGEGAVRDFPGNYSQYRVELRERERSGSKKAPQVSTIEQDATSSQQPTAAIEQPSTNRQKLSYKEQRELEQINKDLPALEAEKAALTADLSTGTLPYDILQQKSDRIQQITSLLEEKEMRWLELSERA